MTGMTKPGGDLSADSTQSDDDTASVLNTEPVAMSWENINVTSKAKRVILKNISGIALPGETLALMGASGAGKTTLLNTLLQRNLKGLHVTGQILCNGHELRNHVTCISSYVQQEDLFVGALTVREHLEIQAMLKVANSSKSERQRRVDEVIDELGLRESENSPIGVIGFKKGISGGEAKRLAFAGQLLSNPSILFADEPTTGLDSFMAAQVVTTLHHLARKGQKTVICTIHSPAAEVFEKFDKVMFLAGGQVAYHGTPERSYEFFGSRNHVIIPPNCNAADVIIHRLAINPADREGSKKVIEDICANYLESPQQKEVYQEILLNGSEFPRPLKGRENIPIHRLLFALWKRTLKDIFRNPAFIRAKFLQKIIMGVFLGFLYFQGEMNQDGILNLKGALFYYIAELTYSTVFGIQTFVPKSFPLLAREYHDGTYPVYCHYAAMVLSYVPMFTMDGVIMTCLSYWLIGLNTSALAFFRAVLINILAESSAVAVGICISSSAPSYAVAISISGPLLTMLSMTGGLYTNVSMMHPLVRWIQYLSWFRYGFESHVINEWEHVKSIACLGNAGKNVSFCEADGLAVIRNLDFDTENLYFNMIIMFLYTIGVYMIGYVGLTIRVILAR